MILKNLLLISVKLILLFKYWLTRTSLVVTTMVSNKEDCSGIKSRDLTIG